MEVDDKIEMKKETIEISGGRKLYNYTFRIEDDEVSNGEGAEEPAGKFGDESEANG